MNHLEEHFASLTIPDESPARSHILSRRSISMFKEKLSMKAQYGEWALVVGGAQGIGEAYCEYLAQQGIPIIVLDNDEAGKRGTVKIAKLLLDHHLNVFHVQYPYKDPGSIPRNKIRKLIADRKRFTQIDLLRKVME